MNTNETTAALPAINTTELVSVVQEAPSILEKNQDSRDRAVMYGENLLSKAQSHGMTDDLDSLMSQYLDKLRVTYKSINERRKPFTQLVDEIKKRFTAIESDIAPSGKENIFSRIQDARNRYATAKIEEQKRREKEAAQKLAMQKEAVQIREAIEVQFSQFCTNITLTAKSDLLSLLEDMTLGTEKHVRETIAMYKVKIQPQQLAKFKPVLTPIYTTAETIEQIKTEVVNEKFTEINLEHMDVINAMKHDLIDQIPSKIQELNEIAKASVQEAERLRKEADDRRREAEAQAAQQAAEAAKKAADQAAAKAAADSLNATINSQANLFEDVPRVKEGVEIIVKNPAAYGLLFQFWFEKEGSRWPYDKIEKMTIGRMKTFCENYALKNDEKIHSALVEYKEIYKAK